jgi:hypothetical protein
MPTPRNIARRFAEPAAKLSLEDSMSIDDAMEVRKINI